MTTIQDRPPNLRTQDGRFYLIRCYACDVNHGRENYALAVASGQCCWCGWQEHADSQLLLHDSRPESA